MNRKKWMLKASLAEKIHHFISLYHDGMVCPSESWRLIASVLEESSRNSVQPKLPDATILLLRKCNLDRPGSFNAIATQFPALEAIRPLLNAS